MRRTAVAEGSGSYLYDSISILLQVRVAKVCSQILVPDSKEGRLAIVVKQGSRAAGPLFCSCGSWAPVPNRISRTGPSPLAVMGDMAICKSSASGQPQPINTPNVDGSHSTQHIKCRVHLIYAPDT